MELCIKNGVVVDWSGSFEGDIYIKDGIISEMGRNLNKHCKTIDAKGLIVMPGFIDLHVHFREPGYTYKEDIESGSRAAVKGGYVMVNLMANTNPVCSTVEIAKGVSKRAKEVGLVEVNQVLSITKDFTGHDLSHLESINKGEVKIISEDGKDVMNSEVMLNAMVKAREKDITVMCHCENHDLSKIDMRLAENTMTWRNLTLAQYSGCKAHFAHVSTKESMEYIIRSKRKGHKVTCEVAPHHLIHTDEKQYRVNPPLRDTEDINYLKEAIQQGYVDAIATDHAPHSQEDKKNGAPGISGIETAFSLCYTELVKGGWIDLCKLSEVMSKRPSEILEVNKGTIDIGYDGDLVLIDIDKNYTIDSKNFLSKGKNTPFNNMKVYGEVKTTIKGGRVVYEKEEDDLNDYR